MTEKEFKEALKRPLGRSTWSDMIDVAKYLGEKRKHDNPR